MRKNKAIAKLLVTVIMMVLLAGCKKEEPSLDTSETETAEVLLDSKATVRPGVISVGIYDLDNALVDVDNGKKAQGFDIDLMNEIGKLTLNQVQYVILDSKKEYALLDVGNFDCIIANIQYSEAADKVYDFTSDYINFEEESYCIIVKTGNNRLLNALNKSLSILSENNVLEAIKQKWFPIDETTSADVK